MISCMISSNSGFFRHFSKMVGDTQRLYLQVLRSNISLRGVVGVVGYESSLNSIAFWASFIHHDLLTLKVWVLNFWDSPPTENQHGNRKQHFSNGWVFPCHLGFRVFFK